MPRVHAANERDILVMETHFIQINGHTSIPVGRVGKDNSKSPKKHWKLAKALVKNLSLNENTTKSNLEESESSCNNLQTEQEQTQTKETSADENITGGINNLPNNETVQTCEEEDEAHAALELEKEQHELRRNVRILLFTELLSGNSSALFELRWQKYIFFLMATIVLCPVSPFAVTLIPAHNVILYPNYWYEYLLQGSTWIIQAGLTLTYAAGCSMNINYLQSPQPYLKSVLAVTVTTGSIFCSVYYIWTQVLQFHFPIPLFAFFAGFFTLFAYFAAIWFSFPVKWRNNTRFRRRLTFFFRHVLFKPPIITM